MNKKAFTVIELEDSKTSTGKDRVSIKTKEAGYFSAFVLDFDGNPTPGIEPLRVAKLPVTAAIEWKENPNPNNPEFPYKNVVSVDLLDPNSEFALSKKDTLSLEELDRRLGIIEDLVLGAQDWGEAEDKT